MTSLGQTKAPDSANDRWWIVSPGMLQLWFIANTVLWPFVVFLGGMQLGLNVVLLSVVGTWWLVSVRKITLTTIQPLLAFAAFLALSFVVAVTGPCVDLLPKFLSTAPVMLFLTLIGMEVGRRTSTEDWLRLPQAAFWAFLFALASFLLEMALPSLFPAKAGYRLVGKYSGLFNEPSHVAFSLFPCVAVMLAAANRITRRWGYVALAILLLLSRSSTLFGLIAAWLIYRLALQRKLKQAAVLVLAASALLILAANINYDLLIAPTLNRIVGVTAGSDADNISSLVYVGGWQDAWVNLTRTKGLGLGFNMMGCHPLPDVPVRTVLAVAGLEELNAQDGSFLFAKAVSEMGVVAIAFYAAVIGWWVKLEKTIREAPHGSPRSAAAIQSALIFCFVASSFLRGPGYFSGGVLLWIAAVSGAVTWKKKLVLNPRAAAKTPAALIHHQA